MITAIDKNGKVQIQEEIRQMLGITAGMPLHVSEQGKQIIIGPVPKEELLA